MKTNEEIRRLMQRALSLVTAPEATACYVEERGLATRFGNNAITQNKGGESASLTLSVACDNRHGSSSTNRLDESGLRDLAKRAEAAAADAPEDPEYMPPAMPPDYPPIPGSFFEATAQVRPEFLADAISSCVAAARGHKMEASGTFEVSRRANAVANSLGLFACHNSTSAEFGVTVQTASGAGKASAYAENITCIDTSDLLERAISVAEKNRDQVELEPGDYVVILSPHAVAALLGFVLWNLDAREADEGVTAFSGKLDQKLFDRRVKVVSPIDDRDIPPPLFGEAGLPVKETVWVDGGVLKRLRHSRFWAGQRGTDPDPHLTPVRMDGEERSFAELISTCRHALLVHRLWYIRYVDRKELMLTGMTRDGLFLVENGSVTRAVKNFRFNESPLTVLQNVVALSRPERVSASAKVPGLVARNFTMSSTTDF